VGDSFKRRVPLGAAVKRGDVFRRGGLTSVGAFIQGRELGVVALMRPIFWGFSWPVGFEVFAGFGVARRSRAPTRRWRGTRLIAAPLSWAVRPIDVSVER
jgi:hypothetical protein